eukprot:gene9215-1301_t
MSKIQQFKIMKKDIVSDQYRLLNSSSYPVHTQKGDFRFNKSRSNFNFKSTSKMKLIWVATVLLLFALVLSKKAPSGYDNNLYDKHAGGSKAQQDSAGKKYYALYDQSLYDDENINNQRNADDKYVDNFRSSDKYNDDYSAKKNKKVSENDDLDKDFNAIRYNKRNANVKNQKKKTHFSQDVFTQDGAPFVTDARLNKNQLRKRNSDYQKKSSNAGHQESTINESYNGGLGKGSPISHSSSKKHSQKHKFGDANENGWNDSVDQKHLDDTKKISLNIKKKKINFDNLEADQYKNNDQIAFDKKDALAKKRYSKDLLDNADLNRNKFANKNLDKSKERSKKLVAIKNAKRNRNASNRKEKDSSDNINHSYDENDFRNKKITRDQKNH